MVRCLGLGGTRTSCLVTRASCVVMVCVGAQERTTAKALSGERDMATHRRRQHTQPTIPTPLACPPPGPFPLPAGASPSQSALSLFLSRCLCLPVPLPNKCCTWCCMHGGGGGHLRCHRVCLWEEGGLRAGQGAGGSSVIPSSFTLLWVSIPYDIVAPISRLLLSLALGAYHVQQALGTMSKSA